MKSILVLLVVVLVFCFSVSCCVVAQNATTTTTEQTFVETTAPWPTSATTSPDTTTTTTSTPSNTSSNFTHISNADYWSILTHWPFFNGIWKITFELCYPEFFDECRPYLYSNKDAINYRWASANAPCVPRWCTCLGGQILANNSGCAAPTLKSIQQYCYAEQYCYPMQDRCADDFIYSNHTLPPQCQKFINCSLRPDVISEQYLYCKYKTICDAEKSCSVAGDPLGTKGNNHNHFPGWYGHNVLPQALRDVWIVTATIFGIVIMVALFGVFLMRRRQREWQHWVSEHSMQSTERADEVVWFEPVDDDNDDKDDNNDKNQSAENNTTATNKNCVRCGSKNAPMQLLPCRCHWCGCQGEPGSGIRVSIPSVSSSENTTTTSATTHSPRESSSAATTTSDQQQQQQNGDNMKEVSALACRGAPDYSGLVPHHTATNANNGGENESQQQQQQSPRRSAADTNVEHSDHDEEHEHENNANANATSSPSRNNNINSEERPTCCGCGRKVNFVINYDKLFYPAASQDVSTMGGGEEDTSSSVATAKEMEEKEEVAETSASASAAASSSSKTPRAATSATTENLDAPFISKTEGEVNDEDQEEEEKEKENKQTSTTSSSLTTNALVSSPLSAPPAHKKKRLPTCCICLSEPCSVAIVPCAHVAQCVECAKKLCVPVRRADEERRAFVISAKCPLCREQITAMVSLSEKENQNAFSKSSSAIE